MSKRAGTVVTMEDLVDAVGVDAARYALVRSLDRLAARHRPRPAGQAHQRQPGLLRAVRPRPHRARRPQRRRRRASTAQVASTPSLLDHETESVLLGVLAEFPRVVAQAAELREPHRVARYLEELAGSYHRWYDNCRVTPHGDEAVDDVHRTRLWLNDATGQVLRTASACSASAPRSGCERRRVPRPRRAAAWSRRGGPSGGGRRRAARRGRRRARPRRDARHAGVRARRGRLPRARARLPRRVRRGVRRARRGVDVYYAGKAFLSVAVARWVHEEGLRVDTATGGELAVALRGRRARARDIGLHGNNKSDAEIGARARRPASAGSSSTRSPRSTRVADAAASAGRAARPSWCASPPACTPAGTSTSPPRTRTRSSGSRSPAAGGDGPRGACARSSSAPSSSCSGSTPTSARRSSTRPGFEVAARAVLRPARRPARRAPACWSPEVDLGGGFGIAYLPGDVAARPRRAWPTDLAAVVAEACARARHAAAAVLHRARPGDRRARGVHALHGRHGQARHVDADDGADFTRTYVSVDGGMSDNIRPALYGAALPRRRRLAGRRRRRGRARPRRRQALRVRRHRRARRAAPRATSRRATCSPSPATGAYGRSMASNYNHVPRPPVVAVADGAARVLVRRETEDDLLALDLG